MLPAEVTGWLDVSPDEFEDFPEFEDPTWDAAVHCLVDHAVTADVMPAGALLWMVANLDSEPDGFLVTLDVDGRRFASEFIEFRHFSDDREATGRSGAESVLAAFIGHVDAMRNPGARPERDGD